VRTQRGRAGAMFLAAALATGGCRSSGGGSWAVRTWQVEPAHEIFGGEPHERVLVTVGDSAHRLEGARLEGDTVIGFEERDDEWRRVAIPRSRADRLEVKKVNPELTVLSLAANAACLILSFSGGR